MEKYKDILKLGLQESLFLQNTLGFDLFDTSRAILIIN